MKKFLCGLAVFAAATAAQAAPYSFSYTFVTGDVVSGQFEGTLQADGNKIKVDSLLGTPKRNGASAGNWIDFYSLTFVDWNIALDPIVSFDGSFMDIYMRAQNVNFALSTSRGGLETIAYPGVGNLAGFDVTKWSITGAGAPVAGAVPEPSSLALVAVALAGVPLVRRRRASK